MSKSKPFTKAAPKLCMFCGKDRSFGKMSREHFVPKGLWDSGRPNGTKTVPAHKKCNNKYDQDNEYFRDVICMEEGAANHPEVQKLHHGAIRRKFVTHYGSIRKTLKNLSLRPAVSSSGLYVGQAPVFDCDWPRMQRVLENVMKGVYHLVNDVPLPQGNEFEIVVPYDTQDTRALVECMGNWQSFGDTVFMCRYAFSSEHPEIMACLMTFYEHRTFLGLARPQHIASPILLPENLFAPLTPARTVPSAIA